MENVDDLISVTVSGSRGGLTRFIEDLMAGRMLPPMPEVLPPQPDGVEALKDNMQGE